MGARREKFWLTDFDRVGTEPNGEWFSWNGKWNGGARQGPRRYVAAYRHIVDLMRAEGADNLQWVWHVNWDDDPETGWNAFENYFPGENYCDWLALSAYGPLTPRTHEGVESFHEKMMKPIRALHESRQASQSLSPSSGVTCTFGTSTQ